MFADYAFELLHDSFYSEIKENLSIINNDDRYFNWYHGYTEIGIPYWQYGNQLDYPVRTTASSGTMSTKYYGEKFDADNVHQNLRIHIEIKTPTIAKFNKNMTLNIEIEKNSLQDLTTGLERYYFDGHGFSTQDEKSISLNIAAPSKNYFINLDRKVTKVDLKNMKLKLMPGFKIDWSYPNDIKDVDAEFSQWTVTKEFVKLTNLLQSKSFDFDLIWRIVKEIRIDFVNNFTSNDKCDLTDSFVSDLDMKENIRKVHEEMNTDALSETLNENLTSMALKSAAEMFIFLNYCPKALIDSPWRKFYKDLFLNYAPDKFVVTLNRILITSKHNKEGMRNVSENLLNRIRETLQLQNQNVVFLTKTINDKSKAAATKLSKCMKRLEENEQCSLISSIGLKYITFSQYFFVRKSF